MPGGGYGITVQGLDELKAALKGSAGGLRDLRWAFDDMAWTMHQNVRKHVAMSTHYTGSSKDGAAHKALPKLIDTITSGATINGPWVQMEREDLMLHEFGGTSRWYRGEGSSLARTVIGTSKRGHDITRMRRVSHGHRVYEKPRTRTGNFLWNVGYRERTMLGKQLHLGIATVCRQHNLPYEMPDDPTIPIREDRSTPAKGIQLDSWSF